MPWYLFKVISRNVVWTWTTYEYRYRNDPLTEKARTTIVHYPGAQEPRNGPVVPGVICRTIADDLSFRDEHSDDSRRVNVTGCALPLLPVTGHPMTYKDYFSLNQTTAELRVLQPVNRDLYQRFTLIIKVGIPNILFPLYSFGWSLNFFTTLCPPPHLGCQHQKSRFRL